MKLALLATLLMLAVVPGAKGDTAQKLPGKPPASSIENQPIHREAAPSVNTGSSTPAPSKGFEPMRVVLALCIVLGIIFVLRIGARRILPGAVALRSNPAVKVLSRSAIAPRQSVLLIQVGKRLIVVGDSGSQLNPLCEISDKEEVDALLAQVHQEAGAAVKRFENFFRRSREPFEATEEKEAPFDVTHELPDQKLDDTRRELSGLTEKVRAVARQIGEA